jgi:retron-type reverse transcriptase
MQHKLATWAETDPNRRFDRLVRLIADRDWLAEAARIVLASSGARTPGIDGIDKRRLQARLDHHLSRDSLLGQRNGHAFNMRSRLRSSTALWMAWSSAAMSVKV